MDTQKLKKSYPNLISYLEENDYSKRYIDKFKREIKYILSNAKTKTWSSYKDIYLEYELSEHSAGYLRSKRNIIGAIEQFALYNKYPDRRTRSKLVVRGAYYQLSTEYKNFIDRYCEIESKRCKKSTTIYTESHNAATFLYALQQQGITNLKHITEKAVLSVFVSENNKLKRSCSYKKNIAAVFKACYTYYPDECSRIFTFFPALRETRKNIQYLTNNEFQKVKNTLKDDTNSLTLRNKAIGTLVLYTGLRGCDIINMTFDSIDWERDIIRIKQQKTKAEFELPMSPLIGNAIYDYVTKERPKIENPYIFLTENKPYNKFQNKSIGNVSVKIIDAAGIRQSQGERKGFHIFRHYLATSLLGNGAPQPVISRTLGHTSPNSLDTYLSANFVDLKKCALSIESFHVSEEVF